MLLLQAPKKEKAPPPSSKPAKSGGGKQKKKVTLSSGLWSCFELIAFNGCGCFLVGYLFLLDLWIWV